MKLLIKFAEKINKQSVINFFGSNINPDNDGISSCEFLCPYGVAGAVSRSQIIVIIFDDTIIAGLRFYPRKHSDKVSVYQFAINNDFRAKGLLKEMFKFSGYKYFESSCCIGAKFNNYYLKTGWTLIKTDLKFNYWEYIL